MTDLTVLEGCKVRSRVERTAEPVQRVSRHAAERYLERIAGQGGPFSEEDLRRAGVALYELFGSRVPAVGPGGGCSDHGPHSGAAGLHSGRVHVLVSSGTIITVLPLGVPAAGCACKTCDRLRRKAGAKYRRSITRGTREGMRLELSEKQPTRRKQLVHRDRNAGHTGRGAAMKDRFATA